MTQDMHILRVACPDQPGLVAHVSTCLFDAGCNIEEASQFNDPLSGQFFMRVAFTGNVPAFSEKFTATGERFKMNWQVMSVAKKLRTVIMVSKADHCLQDLLYRTRTGYLPLEIAAIVSNHKTLKDQAEQAGYKFVHIPAKKEAPLIALIEETKTELIVLARYMQVLSDDFCGRYSGQAINIHHSFLPGFKGANPYAQAHARGVKIIGATAHFVTRDLDEGPIIEQDVARVDHTMGPDKLKRIGQDIETRVLRRALEYYCERRIFLHGQHTVIL